MIFDRGRRGQAFWAKGIPHSPKLGRCVTTQYSWDPEVAPFAGIWQEVGAEQWCSEVCPGVWWFRLLLMVLGHHMVLSRE